MVLAAVDVVDRQLCPRRSGRRRGVGDAAGLGDRGVLARRGGDRGVVVGAGDGDVDVVELAVPSDEVTISWS